MKNLKKTLNKQKKVTSKAKVKAKSVNILVIGCGNMADAIFTGRSLSKKNSNALNLFFINRSPQKAKSFARKFNGRLFHSLEVVPHSFKIDYLFLLIKPQNFQDLTPSLQNFLTSRPKTIIVSFLAALREEVLSTHFSQNTILRIMPHMGVAEGLGSSFVYIKDAQFNSSKYARFMQRFWKPLGHLEVTNKQDILDHGVSLLGSSPALISYLLLAFGQSHQKGLFSQNQILQFQLEIMELLVKWMKQGKSLNELVAKVSSSKGVTQAALQFWKESDLELIMQKGIEQMITRTEEIAAELFKTSTAAKE